MRSRNKHSARQQRSGITVIEFTVAACICTVGILGAMSLTNILLRMNCYASNLIAASIVTETKIDELRKVPYEELASGSDSVTGLRRTWNVVVDPSVDCKVTTVLTEWNGFGPKTHQVKLRGVFVE